MHWHSAPQVLHQMKRCVSEYLLRVVPSSLLLSEHRPSEAYRSLNILLPGPEFRSNVPLGLDFHVEDDQCQFYHFYFELSRFKDQAQPYTHNHSGHHQEEICRSPQKATGSDTLAFIFDPISEFEGDIIAKLSHITETRILMAIGRNQADGNLDARKLGFTVRIF